jgi:hypothetical protein
VRHGKSHLAQAIGRAAILQGYRVVYREAHTLFEELTEATLAGTRKDYLVELATVQLLIIDDLGMRKLAHTAAEDLLELANCRFCPVRKWPVFNCPPREDARLLCLYVDRFRASNIMSSTWFLPRGHSEIGV